LLGSGLYAADAPLSDESVKAVLCCTPVWLQPRGYFDLLRYSTHITLGISTMFGYVGGLGTRSPLHMDNNGLPAAHWNFGPCCKLWFLIALSYRQQVFTIALHVPSMQLIVGQLMYKPYSALLLACTYTGILR